MSHQQVESLDVELRPEIDADRQGVWNVNRTAFPTDAEANLADALRDGGYSRVSLVRAISATLTAVFDMIATLI